MNPAPLFSGLVSLPWWGYAVVGLVLTHITIVAVTVLLHRCQTHHALDSMRRDLTALWQRSTASREQLVSQLQDWCRRAEASGVEQLAAFSERLRSCT